MKIFCWTKFPRYLSQVIHTRDTRLTQGQCGQVGLTRLRPPGPLLTSSGCGQPRLVPPRLLHREREKNKSCTCASAASCAHLWPFVHGVQREKQHYPFLPERRLFPEERVCLPLGEMGQRKKGLFRQTRWSGPDLHSLAKELRQRAKDPPLPGCTASGDASRGSDPTFPAHQERRRLDVFFLWGHLPSSYH